MDGGQSRGRSFQVETKRPLIFFLPPATLSFLPATDPGGDLWRDNLASSATGRRPRELVQ